MNPAVKVEQVGRALKPETRFARRRIGWGRDYGTRYGMVLYHNAGSTRVRWEGEAKTKSFTNRDGEPVTFTSDGSREENICHSTLVEVI